MTSPDANQISRTVLLGIRDGSQPTYADAVAAHAATGLVIVADDQTCCNTSGQAALLTAVTTGVRAFGQVMVFAGPPETTIVTGPYRGQSLATIVTAEGAQLINDEELTVTNATWPTLVIGPTTDIPPHRRVQRVCTDPLAALGAPILRSTWTGWTATVSPVEAPASPGRSSDDTCILAAIAAAALAVSEAFTYAVGRPGSDAGYRSASLNLWSPTELVDSGPKLSFAPANWWLVGLGHLGQAYSWVLGWLSYRNPARVQIVLQDTDKTTPANHSTGLLTPIGSNGVSKTRLIAQSLEAAGFDTSIIERRLDSGLTVLSSDVHVALLGVDNLATRRLISGVGWRLAIDAGLGAGADDYSSILLRRFPGSRHSSEVPGWADGTAAPAKIPDTPAFEDLRRRTDACGLVELAGKAVGAAFVGAIAACLVVAEAVRELHDGCGFDVLTINLATMDSTNAPATVDAEAISLPLRVAD